VNLLQNFHLAVIEYLYRGRLLLDTVIVNCP